MKNKWKDIASIPGYQVSDLGHIRNKDTRKVLQEQTNSSTSRYLRVHIGTKHYLIHRIVAVAFVPNPFGFTEVDHVNRDKTDNSASNLEWVSHSMNMKNLQICIRLGIKGKKPNKRCKRKVVIANAGS